MSTGSSQSGCIDTVKSEFVCKFANSTASLTTSSPSFPCVEVVGAIPA